MKVTTKVSKINTSFEGFILVSVNTTVDDGDTNLLRAVFEIRLDETDLTVKEIAQESKTRLIHLLEAVLSSRLNDSPE